MPKFTIEKVVQITYKQDVDARDMTSALNKSKRKRNWKLDDQSEQYTAYDSEDSRPIGFGRRK